MNKIHKNRVKRKRILEARKKCHGNVFACSAKGEHLFNTRKVSQIPKINKNQKIYLPEVKKPEKAGFFKRMFGGA
ncbi:MAG: hypothetical protein AABY22_33050 [Nanoarchaeota archaeon]